MQTRDEIIIDLATRLERALELLDLEREQQRQRRQIIFPSPAVGGEGLESELKTTKDALRECQGAMNQKELEWKMKMESLERQLEAARSLS